MSLAFVRVISDSENRIVKTENIVDFDKYLKKPAVDDLYILKVNRKKKSCSILAVGETKEEINKIINSKRIRYPVFNTSDIINENDEIDKKDEEEEAKKLKKERKKCKEAKKRSALESTKYIIDKYKKSRKKMSSEFNEENKENKGKRGKNTEQEVNKKKYSKSESPPEDTDNNDETREFLEEAQDDVQDMSDEAERNEFISNKEKLNNDEIIEKIDEIQLKSYEQLLEENMRLQNKLEKYLTSQPSTSQSSSTSHPSASEKVSENLFHLGGNYFVKTEAYEKATEAKDASKFITTLAYGLWGYEALAERCVRQQKNVKKPPLTPEKISYIKKHFKKYLTKRNYPENLYWHEVGKVNAYLGRAITGAKRHLMAETKNRTRIELTVY